MNAYAKALAQHAEQIEADLPARVRTMISLAHADLMNGPVYGVIGTLEDGDPAYWGEDYDEPFSFQEAVRAISDALDDVEAVFFETWSGCILTDPDDIADPSECYIIERRDVIGAICGRELAQHVA